MKVMPKDVHKNKGDIKVKTWISKKKNEPILVIHIEDQIDYKEIMLADRYDIGVYYKDSLSNLIRDKAIDKWINLYGAELFNKFNSDDALKEIKIALVKKILQ